jgi:hypothetical protein
MEKVPTVLCAFLPSSEATGKEGLIVHRDKRQWKGKKQMVYKEQNNCFLWFFGLLHFAVEFRSERRLGLSDSKCTW